MSNPVANVLALVCKGRRRGDKYLRSRKLYTGLVHPGEEGERKQHGAELKTFPSPPTPTPLSHSPCCRLSHSLIQCRSLQLMSATVEFLYLVYPGSTPFGRSNIF